MLEYTSLPEEPPSKQSADLKLQKNGSWPAKGEIEFKNVFCKYEGTNKYALNGINLKIAAGEKIGVVGRTGAGKSTLI